ncbi:MAG: ImpA family metalloprotease [Methyloglobulus sp.]|nr:cellulase family glycosylhydrolase [Methyloglobulus sp.]
MISGIPTPNVSTGVGYSFTPTASDADNDTLTYSITNKPVWATFNSATGELSGTPSLANIGKTKAINVSVSDGKSALVSLPTFDLTVAIDPLTYQAGLGVGIDVDWANTNPGINAYKTDMVRAFVARGIKHVRIRVQFDLTQPASPQSTITLLQHLDKVVQDCLDNGLVPVIAYYATVIKQCPVEGTNCTQAQADENRTALISWWRTVAEHFKDFSPKLSFNLIVETTDALGKLPDVLNSLYAEVIPVIRATNPTRLIMAAPIKISDPVELPQLQLPPNDPYLMAEWHFYAAGPQKDNVRKQWTIGSTDEQKLITDAITAAKSWQTNHIPTWVGAWMANNFNDLFNNSGGDYSVPEQAIFASFMSYQLEKAGIPFAVNSDTKFYDRDKLEWIKAQEPVLDEILRKKSFVPNTPPVIAGVPATLAEVGKPYLFKPTVSDTEDSIFLFAVLNKPTWMVFNAATGELSGTPTANDILIVNNVQIIVSDRKDGISALPAFNLTVHSAAYKDALQTGMATGITAPELRLEADTFVANTKTQQAQTINNIFRLANNGSLQTESISGITWDPSHDSVWLNNLNPVANMPTLVSNAAAKSDKISQKKTLGIAGVKANGARYAVMGANPLHDLSRTTEPGGTGNAQLNEFLKSQLAWLTQRNDLATSTFKVVIAHQSDSYWFKHDATTRNWITTNYPNATVNISDECESALLAGCLSGANLLVIGRDNGSEDNHSVPFDLNTVMQTVKTAQANGIPVLYLQYDGSMNDLGLAMMDYFSLTTTDNYWRQEYLDNFSPTSLNVGASNNLDAIQTVIDALDSGTYNFAFDSVNCVNNVGTINCDAAKVNDQTSGNTLQTQFFAGVETIRASLQALDQKNVNVFALDDSYRLLKTAILLGDKYREQIHYPMDKINTDNATFFKALFADYTVHYARPNNAYQPDMGDFTDAQVVQNTAPTISKTLSYTPTVFDEWTSTGLYAPPGKTITVRRTDNGTSEVKIRFNYLRESTKLWNSNQYSRPRYMASPAVTLKAGQTYTLSTPYGGPIYLGWTAAQTGATPFTVELSNVLDNPLLQTFDDASINFFLNDVEATNSDWIDLKTPFSEIHTLKSNMLSAFAQQDGNTSNGYVYLDVQSYIDDLNKHLILGNYAYAGFSGEGLPQLNTEVQSFCTAFQLTNVAYDGATKNLCTDAVIHAKPKIQHINSDVHALCGGLCAGNPFDSGSPIMPLDWGENHEMGHNLQRNRFNIYGRSGEVSNNIFPLHTQWSWTVAKGLSKHPSQTRPANQAAFNILQNAIKAGTLANSSHPLWSGTGIYDNAFERLSFFMQLVYTQQSWDVHTKMYLMERIYSDAIKSDAKWNAVKDKLGFGNYSLNDTNGAALNAKNISANDFMYIAASVLGGRNYSDYFEAWGIEITQAAKDQVASNNIIIQVPKVFYYVNNELPAAMPTVADTIPLDGISQWLDPTP